MPRRHWRRRIRRSVPLREKGTGANQVSIVTSTAERKAAVEFAEAAAIRPQVVGAALQRVSQEPAVAAALFAVLETQRLIDGEARLTLVPADRDTSGAVLAAEGTPAPPHPPRSPA